MQLNFRSHFNDFFNRDPTEEEIKQSFKQFFYSIPDSNIVGQIKTLLEKKKQKLFHVFSLDRDKNVAETIFKAIFAGICIHFTE